MFLKKIVLKILGNLQNCKFDFEDLSRWIVTILLKPLSIVNELSWPRNCRNRSRNLTTTPDFLVSSYITMFQSWDANILTKFPNNSIWKRSKNNDPRNKAELDTCFSPSLRVNFHAVTNRKYTTTGSFVV